MILFYSQPRVHCDFTAEQHETAANFFKEHPVLYNKKHINFRNPTLKKALKQELADLLNVEYERVKVWYTSTRSELGRIERKIKKSGGVEAAKLTDLQLLRHEQLQFMDGSIEPRSKRNEVIPVRS